MKNRRTRAKSTNQKSNLTKSTNQRKINESDLTRAFKSSCTAIYSDSKLQDFVFQLHPLRFKDVSHQKFENSEALLQLLNIIGNIRTSFAVLWNNADFLELPALAELRHQHRVPFCSGKYRTSGDRDDVRRCWSWVRKDEVLLVLAIDYEPKIYLKNDDSRTLAHSASQSMGSTNLAAMEAACSSRLVNGGTVVDEAPKIIVGHDGGRW
ncbi:hypothetical protein U1Q18_014237 [Sarracenia purpurea var. burkii]